jgi:TonB family protein
MLWSQIHWPTLFLALLSAVIVSAACADSVPLTKTGGTYTVPVNINGKITLQFTLDSGASDVSIPSDVFSTLVRTETILTSDLLGFQKYVLADGSEHRTQRFRIRSLTVGTTELRDVVGSVAPTAGVLLLGQSYLSRIPVWSIDNKAQLLYLGENRYFTARKAEIPVGVSESRAVPGIAKGRSTPRGMDEIVSAPSGHVSSSVTVVAPVDFYPAMSRRMGEEGVVAIDACADHVGTPKDARVVASSGYERLDGAAVDFGRSSEFGKFLSPNDCRRVFVRFSSDF